MPAAASRSALEEAPARTGRTCACCRTQARLARGDGVAALAASACSRGRRRRSRRRPGSARCRRCAPARGWPAGPTAAGRSHGPWLRAPTPTPNRCAAGSGTSVRARSARPARPRRGGRRSAPGPAGPGAAPAPAARRSSEPSLATTSRACGHCAAMAAKHVDHALRRVDRLQAAVGEEQRIVLGRRQRRQRLQAEGEDHHLAAHRARACARPCAANRWSSARRRAARGRAARAAARCAAA